ncbi:uncharacterized protein LOC135466682 isoform X2 [Liolophura sinensis]|uniref:uncharacterized protein LOC135466682 isoform X2 n=1 Tax=Liolophura sinensis TaxID=3198878 RepID=UPI0031596C7F
MSDWVVIYSGGTVTSTIQEKCNLRNITWLNVDEPCAEPSELNFTKILFIVNKRFLSFLRKRQNHRWMKFLDAVAEKGDSGNNLSSTAENLQAVVFAGLSGEDLENGDELFQGLEKILLEPGQDLSTLLMQILVRGTGQILSSSQEHMPQDHSIPPGYGSVSDYVMGCTSGLDATRSMSSCGLAMAHPQSMTGLADIHAPSHMTPPHQASCPNSSEMAYIPLPVSELRISLDDQHLHPPQGGAVSTYHSGNGSYRGMSHQHGQHVYAQPFNITSDRSLEDNNSSGVSSSPWPMTSYKAGLSTEGGACHVDPKPSSSWTGDKASGLYDDDSLVIDLPVTVMQYLTSEMDISPNYGKGWTELAALKGYIHSRVNRIKGNHSIESPFQYLLGQQEFSGYTYGQLKRDLKILPRLDILRRLQNGNFM